MIVSATTFIRLSDGVIKGMDELPITQFFIKIDKDLSDEDYNDFHDKIQTAITLSQVHK